MKIFNKILSFALVTFLMLITTSILFDAKNSRADVAISPDDFFDAYLTSYVGNEYADDHELTKNPYENNNAVYFVNRGANAVTVSLGFGSHVNRLSNLVVRIKVNGDTYDLTGNSATAQLINHGMQVSENEGVFFTLRINPALVDENEFAYGKYTFDFSFNYENVDDSLTHFDYSRSIYVLRNSDYNKSEIRFNNTLKSENGARFFSNYSKNDDNANLMYLSYNYRFYNVNISRISQGLTESTSLSYTSKGLTISSLDELGASTQNNVVDINVVDDEAGNKAYITFRELGKYYISYTPICPFSNYEALTKYYSDGTNEIVAMQTNQTAYVFGYQLMYTDSNGLKEFKYTNQTKAYEIDGTEYTADITSIIGGDISKIFNSTIINPEHIAKTNQAPVYFISNASIIQDDSYYCYFNNLNTFKESSGLPTITDKTESAYKVEKYTGTPLSKAGLYFISLTYTYNEYSTNPDDTKTQYFLFRITNDAPEIEIKTINPETGLVEDGRVDADTYTYKNISISKSSLGIFDSSSILTIYKDVAFNGSYDRGVIIPDDETVVLNQNARYKLQLSYGNENKKGFTTYFTIDDTDIEDLHIHTLSSATGYSYVKSGVLSTDSALTNSLFAISWKEKESGVKSHLDYKYFPTKYSTSNEVGLSSDVLYTMYNSEFTKYAIPSTYIISYNGGNLPISEYTNTYDLDLLSGAEIIAGGGLYIFYLYDETGRDGRYFSVFLDDTPNSIITTSNYNDETDYKIATESEFTSIDRTLLFGKDKLIKIDYSGSTWDEWLFNEYFDSNNSVNYKGQIYLKVGVSNIVYMVKDSSETNRIVLSGDYKYENSATSGQGADIKYNESQYDFYTICASTNAASPYQTDSLYYYMENCTAQHSITFSTDNSKMKLYYELDGKQKMLSQREVISSNSEKVNYYQPSTPYTMGNVETLYLNYCTDPSSTLSVNSIVLNYYPFVKNATNKTYAFNLEPSATIRVYESGSDNKGIVVAGESNTYKYSVNLEQYDQNKTRTASGKYEIIRTYASDGIDNDPKVRKLVFIVDRNGIISEPDSDEYGNSVYYTGGSIALGVTGGINEFYDSLQYYDIYYASKLSEGTPVLTTNFLPVTVYIPQYKYAYLGEDDSGAVKSTNENSIIRYYGNGDDSRYYNYYKLRAVVYYYPTKSENYTETYIYNANNKTVNGFINANNTGTLQAFNKVGKYRVEIKDDAGDKFTYYFEIVAEKPEFSLLNQDNSAIYEKSQIYYTNKEVVRITWEDSANKFLSTINTNEIKYTINGFTYRVDTSVYNVVSAGNNKYYLDLNLQEIGGFVDGTEIKLTLQFKGEAKDYADPEYFAKTVTLMVDLEAPVNNIQSLIQTTGLGASDLREYISGEYNKYNTSKSSGLLKYYAYIVDISNFYDLIKLPSDENTDYYKSYYRVFNRAGVNTKYVAGFDVETDISKANISGNMTAEMFTNPEKSDYITEFRNYINKYIEIVEEDYAGNRTVYTIYLTDVLSESATQKDAVHYTRLTNSSDGEKEEIITNGDIASSNGTISLYSKNSFKLKSIQLFSQELGDLSWSVIKVNGKVYVKSPYTYGMYYSYSSSQDTTAYSLEEISLLQSNNNTQQLYIYSVPKISQLCLDVHVLNQNLSIYKISQIEEGLQEGILIRIPANIEASNNLYAKSLQILTNINGNNDELINISGLDAEFLTKEMEISQDILGLDITYKNVGSYKYVRIQITKKINVNDYFIYNIVDNFDDKYTVINIYGQTIIKEPITSDGYVVSGFDDYGAIYYSSEDIAYKYDTTIYKTATLNIVENIDGSVATRKYNIIKQNDSYYVQSVDEEGEVKTITADKYIDDMIISFSYNILTIKMVHIKYNFNEDKKVLGGSKLFELIINPKEDFNIESEKIRFEIFNEIPSGLNIIGKQTSSDALQILVGDKAYPDSVIINYIKSILKFDYDIIIQMPNQSFVTIRENLILDEDGTYTLTINYLGAMLGCSLSFTFRIANTENFKYSVAKLTSNGTFEEVEATGSAFTFVKDGGEHQIINHYIVNDEYKIMVNSNLDLEVSEYEIQPDSKYFTTIYVITNKNSTTNAPKSYDKVAITKLNKTDDLLKRLLVYGGNIDQQNNDLIRQNLSRTTAYVTTIDEYETGIKVAWSKYSEIKENTIGVEVYYGDLEGSPLNATISDVNGLNSITLKTSGTYYLRFVDKAGNTHLFGNNSSYRDSEFVTLRYLSSVIYEINGDIPINYSIFNNEVNIKVPQNTISYYAIDGKPRINVELNGEECTDYTKNGTYDYTFTKPGLYKVWFTAKIGENSIYEAPIYFTILSSSESRISYTHTGYGTYYIEDILLNNVSVKDDLTNINSGEMYGDYLKNIYIHANDIKTGIGYWTFVINTDNEFNQKFTYTVWINRPNIPIEVSVGNGQTTTSNITVSFNTSNLINNAGDCVLKITGYMTLEITKEKLDAGELKDVYNITIDGTGKYYIEVATTSGQLLYSYYVEKAEPLNTISIIIIVVSALLAVSGSIVFVLMRRRMKIR